MGAVKRRLARGIGDVAAAGFYRRCLVHTVLRLSADPRWRTLIAVTPDHHLKARFWPAPHKVGRLPQGRGDLGTRIQRLLRFALPGPVIIVGSDIPGLRPAHIAHAFKLLGHADAVFGPAPDGGFWLVGLRRSPRLLSPFAGARWSTPHALADTLANLEGNSVAFVSELTDVDTSEGYSAERDFAGRLIMPLAKRASVCA